MTVTTCGWLDVLTGDSVKASWVSDVSRSPAVANTLSGMVLVSVWPPLELFISTEPVISPEAEGEAMTEMAQLEFGSSVVGQSLVCVKSPVVDTDSA